MIDHQVYNYINGIYVVLQTLYFAYPYMALSYFQMHLKNKLISIDYFILFFPPFSYLNWIHVAQSHVLMHVVI